MHGYTKWALTPIRWYTLCVLWFTVCTDTTTHRDTGANTHGVKTKIRVTAYRCSTILRIRLPTPTLSEFSNGKTWDETWRNIMQPFDSWHVGGNCLQFITFCDLFIVKETPKHIQRVTIRYKYLPEFDSWIPSNYITRGGWFQGSLRWSSLGSWATLPSDCHGHRKVIGAGALGALFFTRLGGIGNSRCLEVLSVGKSSKLSIVGDLKSTPSFIRGKW